MIMSKDNPCLLKMLFNIFRESKTTIGFDLVEEDDQYRCINDDTNKTWWKIIFSPTINQLFVSKRNSEPTVSDAVVTTFISHKTTDMVYGKDKKAFQNKAIYESNVLPALTGRRSIEFFEGQTEHLNSIIQLGIKSLYSGWSDRGKPLLKENLNKNIQNALQENFHIATEELKERFLVLPKNLLDTQYAWFENTINNMNGYNTIEDVATEDFLHILTAALILGLNVSPDFNDESNALNQNIKRYIEKALLEDGKKSASPSRNNNGERIISTYILQRYSVDLKSYFDRFVAETNQNKLVELKRNLNSTVESIYGAVTYIDFSDMDKDRFHRELDNYTKSLHNQLKEPYSLIDDTDVETRDYKFDVFEEIRRRLEVNFYRLLIWFISECLKEPEDTIEKEVLQQAKTYWEGEKNRSYAEYIQKRDENEKWMSENVLDSQEKTPILGGAL